MPSITEILSFLHNQLFVTPPIFNTSFAGRTIIITGANTGLGLEAAKHFARLNVSHLILGCRDISKGEAAKAQILAGCAEKTQPRVEVWRLDMADYASVVAFGDRACRQLQCLDAFVANAGISVRTYEVAESNESTLTIKVVSTVLLAMLVLRKLRETGSKYNVLPHLTILGSAVHYLADDKQLSEPSAGAIFSTLNDPQKADMDARYYISKLLDLQCVEALAAQLDASGAPAVVVNCVNPGWCKTELFRNNDRGALPLKILGRTSEVGSRTLVHAASAGQASHGMYLSECRVTPKSPWTRSAEGRRVGEDVWNEVLAMLEGIRPGVTEC